MCENISRLQWAMYSRQLQMSMLAAGYELLEYNEYFG